MAYVLIYDARRWVRSDSTDVTIVLPIAAGGTGLPGNVFGGTNLTAPVGVGTVTPLAALDVVVPSSTLTNNIRFGDATWGYLASGSAGVFLSNNAGVPLISFDQATKRGTLTAPITLKGYTVASLPAGVVGDRAYVTDALAPAYGAVVVGGGAVLAPVFYDGASWRTM